MTKKERQFLRSAFFFYDKRTIRHTNTPDIAELAREWRDHQRFMNIVKHVLSLQGDVDGESEEHLKDVFEEHKIPYLK